MHYIYKITNHINQKVYIGQTKDISKRWYQHKKETEKEQPSMIVNSAMKKYGIDNFTIEIIVSCLDQNSANEAEEICIKQENSHISNGKGYNVSNGGSVAPKTEEFKRKVSQTLMGHEVSQEARNKISKGNIGKVRSDEFKNNVGDFWRGKERSEEHRQNLAKSLKGNQNCLGNQNGLGYQHTEDAKKKIGDAIRGKSKHNQGKTWKIIDGKRVWMVIF